MPLKKQTWGLPSANPVVLFPHPPSPKEITYLAEGPETAFSILMALKGEKGKKPM